MAAADQEFDGQEVVKHLVRRRPQDYVRHLYLFVTTTDQIQQEHATIGRRLATSDTPEKADRPVNANIRGGENANQGWRKK